MMTNSKKIIGTSTELLDSSTFRNYTWIESAVVGGNTFNVSKATTTASLTLTGLTGDIINIAGYSGDYTASVSGTKLSLLSDDQAISVKLAKSSVVTLKFLDTSKSVDFSSSKAPKLDDLPLTSKALHLNGVTSHEMLALIGTPFSTVKDLLTSYNNYKAIAPTFSVSSTPSTLEGTSAIFTVKLSATLDIPASVSIALTGIGNTTSSDYNINGTVTGAKGGAGNVLTFSPGQTTAIVKFPVLSDTISEVGEGLTLTLNSVKDSIISVKTGATFATTKIDDPTSTINVDANTKTLAATLGIDTFNIATGTYTTTIQNFANGDKLHFFSGAILNIPTDTNFNDGTKSITATDESTNSITTIVLTGLSPTQDTAISDITSFNTVFNGFDV